MGKASVKTKILALFIVVLTLVSCGGGGGGGSGGGGYTPTPVENTPSQSIESRENTISSEYSKYNINFSTKPGLVGIIDSVFSTSKLSELGNRIDIINKPGSYGDDLANGYTHGENVALIIGKGYSNIYIYGIGAGAAGGILLSSSMYYGLKDKGVKIYNNSFGSSIDEPIEKAYPAGSTFTRFFRDNAGSGESLFIWAAGNEKANRATPDARFPELYKEAENGWIAVTAINSGDRLKASYSNAIGDAAKNWGIAAIGDYTYMTGGRTVFGTSFATPAVSRGAARVMVRYPWMSAEIVKLTLLSTTDKPGEHMGNQNIGGPDATYGWGILNENRALGGPAKFDKRLTHVTVDALGRAIHADDVVISIKGSEQNRYDIDQFSFTNIITGDAGFRLQSPDAKGLLIFTKNNSYTGDTTVEGGELIITDRLTGSNKIEINKDGTFTALGAARIAFDASEEVVGVSGKRNVEIVGDIINNAGDFNVKYGDLKLTGNITNNAGAVNFESKGVFGVEITGNMFNNSNRSGVTTDSASMSIRSGKVKIAGDFISDSDTKLFIDINSGIVAKTIKLNDAVIRIGITNHDVFNAPANVIVSNTLLEAKSGDIQGFTQPIVNDADISTYITFTVTGPSIVPKIEIRYNRIDFLDAAKTIMAYIPANVENTGENLDKVFDSLVGTDEDSSFKTAAADIIRTPAAFLPDTWRSLSGEIYASSENIVFKQSKAMNKDLSNRLYLISDEENKGGIGFWSSGIGTKGKIYQKGWAQADTEVYGAQVGGDIELFDGFIIGGAVSASKAKADFDKFAGKANSTNVTLSAYGIYSFPNSGFYALGRLGIGFSDADVERDIIYGPDGKKEYHLKSNHDDTNYSGYAELGYKYEISNDIKVTPFVGLMHDTVKRGKFTEKGNDFGITAKAEDYSQTSGVAGVRAQAKISKLKLNGHLTHVSAFNKEDLSFKAHYVGDTKETPIRVKGAALPKNTTWVGVGVEIEAAQDLTISVSYDMSIERAEVADNVISLGLRYKIR
ncbi:MAG: autotransporter domain-containing protein [Fusobacteriaceae bacterium]|jgi:autotransporter-associated beta strand protein|nr:autotransporter domain-containing protein [Fusobacteriaceae bacterium]